jgi:hypothetical protein
MKISLLPSLLAGSLLLACGATRATGYQDSTNPLLGWMGGYWESKGPGELIKVGFSGNNFSTHDKIRSYLLYRCAEIVKREGKEYFAFYRNLPAAVRDQRSSEKYPSLSAGKPAVYAYILMFDAEAPGLLSASELLAQLKSEIE